MSREQAIRHEVLLQLYGLGLDWKISAAQMARTAKRNGDDFTERELLQGALFHVGQGFAVEETNPGTGQRKFGITSKGVIHWENVEGK